MGMQQADVNPTLMWQNDHKEASWSGTQKDRLQGSAAENGGVPVTVQAL